MDKLFELNSRILAIELTILYKSILLKKNEELKRVSPRTKLCPCNAFKTSDPGYLMWKGLVRNHIQAQKNPKKFLTFFQNRKTEQNKSIMYVLRATLNR